jgi:uncharacterized protein (TIGR03083 family)
MQTASNTNREDSVVRPALAQARAIPALTHTEATTMATCELERFLALVTSLSDEEWEQPTACPLWNVRQMVAHVTGAFAASASFAEFKRQGSARVQRPYRASGLSFLDSMNQIQVDDRAHKTPAALIDELREVGPRAIANRAKLPALLRAVRVPLPPLGGIVPIGYLTDLIYTRDRWMHRLDICLATGREMVMTPEHDGRVVALVMRDLAKLLATRLRKASLVYQLSGRIGGTWQLGTQGAPAATLGLDVLDFNLLASGRLSPEEAWARASSEGDRALAREMLNHTIVPY